HRQADPKRLSQLLRGELDWIVLKALEKDRSRRYESASAFAADVERDLQDEPVQACPPSAGYRLRKLARRNRAALGTVAVVAAALMSGTGISIWQAVEAQDARREAEANFELARKAVDETMTKVAEEPRLKETDFHDLRRSLLSSAVPFYEEFVK